MFAVPPSGRHSSGVSTMVPARPRGAHWCACARPAPGKPKRCAHRRAVSAPRTEQTGPHSGAAAGRASRSGHVRWYGAALAGHLDRRHGQGCRHAAALRQAPASPPLRVAQPAGTTEGAPANVPPGNKSTRRSQAHAASMQGAARQAPARRAPGAPVKPVHARACAPLMSTVLTRKSDSAEANSCPEETCFKPAAAAGATPPAPAADSTAVSSTALTSQPVPAPGARRGISPPSKAQRGRAGALPAAHAGAAAGLGSDVWKRVCACSARRERVLHCRAAQHCGCRAHLPGSRACAHYSAQVIFVRLGPPISPAAPVSDFLF